LDDASVPSAIGGGAHVFKRVTTPRRGAATKFIFILALFVCAVVIKSADEDIGDSDYEHSSGNTNHALAFVRSTLCAFARRMC
jgi:hypothetical protein